MKTEQEIRREIERVEAIVRRMRPGNAIGRAEAAMRLATLKWVLNAETGK